MGRGRRVFTPQKTLDAEAHIASCVVLPDGWPTDADYWLTLTFYFDCGRFGDLDNLAKTVQDALNNHGAVWDDDKHVVSLVAHRHFDAEARTEVSIRAVPRVKYTKKKTRA